MKTSIKITGSGISSKKTLLFELQTNDCDLINLPFNDYELVFMSKKDAIKSLSAACISLRDDKEDWKISNGSYRYADFLSYDAGIARII